MSRSEKAELVLATLNGDSVVYGLLPPTGSDVVLGDYWLDSAPLLMESGTFDATGFLHVRHPIGGQIPRGVVVAIRGVVVDSTGIQLALPSIQARGGSP